MITKTSEELLKEAFAVSDEGHELDSKRYKAISDLYKNVADAEEDYQVDAPVRGFLRNGLFGTSMAKAMGNKAEYSGLKHQAGKNDYGLLAGYSDKAVDKLRDRLEEQGKI